MGAIRTAGDAGRRGALREAGNGWRAAFGGVLKRVAAGSGAAARPSAPLGLHLTLYCLYSALACRVLWRPGEGAVGGRG